MGILGKIKEHLKHFPRHIKHDENPCASYFPGAVTAGQLLGKKIVLCHNKGTISSSVVKRLESEHAMVRCLDYTGDIAAEQHLDADCFVVVVEWNPSPEMMRLKTISRDVYENFFVGHTANLITLLKKRAEKDRDIKLITLFPSYSFEEKYGFTLYGIVAQYIASLSRGMEDAGMIAKYINIEYDQVPESSMVLKEYISAIVTMLCGHMGDVVNQDVIKIGISADSLNPTYHNRLHPSFFNRMMRYSPFAESVCGGTLADTNTIFVYNDELVLKRLKKYFEKEKSYCYHIACDSGIREESLVGVERTMIGCCDNMVNVVNCSNLEDPIKYIYRLFQVESPYLTSRYHESNICTVLMVNDSKDRYLLKKTLPPFIRSLGGLLRNHHIVINAVLGCDVDIYEVAATVAFLCSEYGQAMTGETLILG